MRAAVEKELRGVDATLDESEQRISASLERYSKQVRRVSTGQQALFAYVDALTKVILSTLPDTVLEPIWWATLRRRFRNW